MPDAHPSPRLDRTRPNGASTGYWLPVAIALMLWACAASDTPREQEPTAVQPEAKAVPARSARAQVLARQRESLDAAVARAGKSPALVEDVRTLLLAEEQEADGQLSTAVKTWFQALSQADGPLGERALTGWLKAYTKQLSKRSEPDILARLIMAETQRGAVSPYMTSKGLTSEAAILPLLKAKVPDAILAVAEAGPSTPPPAERGLPPQDPLLVKSATASCAAGQLVLEGPAGATWRQWIASLSTPQKTYWEGLLAQTCGESDQAARAFADALPQLEAQDGTQALAVEAAGRLATLDRGRGRRAEAAETYARLYKLWELPGVTAKSMGLRDGAFALRRIEDLNWIALYRSMVGDYELAKIAAQKALDHIGNAMTIDAAAFPKGGRAKLATLKAELYHALAFRIAVEKHEYDSARSLALLALDTPGLTREWIERLHWYAGLYDYLGGHFDGAASRWSKIATQTRSDSLRAALLYWGARAQTKLGRLDEARASLRELVDAYPLSFYATMVNVRLDDGPTSLSPLPDQAPDWRQSFGDPAALRAKASDRPQITDGAVRADAKLARLADRAAVLIDAGLRRYGKLAIDELEANMGRNLDVREHSGAYLQLSRLAYSAGAYLKTINLTSKVQKVNGDLWRTSPEQLLYFFPRPYSAAYHRNAQETGVDQELLLAISRQESGFSPDIRSSANAVGLMQLIHPTAKRFAAELGMATDHIEKTLKSPEANIRIGSRYLKFLQQNYKGFPPAVFGGYNAGEYAVDLWLKRRAHSDPMVFVELIPFNETKEYVKSVWRNVLVYKFLGKAGPGGLEAPEPPSEEGEEANQAGTAGAGS